MNLHINLSVSSESCTQKPCWQVHLNYFWVVTFFRGGAETLLMLTCLWIFMYLAEAHALDPPAQSIRMTVLLGKQPHFSVCPFKYCPNFEQISIKSAWNGFHGTCCKRFFSWLFSMGSKHLIFKMLWTPRVCEEVLYNIWTWKILNSALFFLFVCTVQSDECIPFVHGDDKVAWCPKLCDFSNLNYHALNKKQQAWKQICLALESLVKCFLMQQLKAKTLHCSFFLSP